MENKTKLESLNELINQIEETYKYLVHTEDIEKKEFQNGLINLRNNIAEAKMLNNLKNHRYNILSWWKYGGYISDRKINSQDLILKYGLTFDETFDINKLDVSDEVKKILSKGDKYKIGPFGLSKTDILNKGYIPIGDGNIFIDVVAPEGNNLTYFPGIDPEQPLDNQKELLK